MLYQRTSACLLDHGFSLTACRAWSVHEDSALPARLFNPCLTCYHLPGQSIVREVRTSLRLLKVEHRAKCTFELSAHCPM